MNDWRPTRRTGAATLALILLAAGAAQATAAPDGDGPRTTRTFRADEPAAGYFADARFEEDCEAGFFTDRTFGSAVDAQGGEWSIEISHGRCELEVEMTGEIELRPDGRGIARMGRGARMTIDEDAAVDRRLEVTRGVNGVPQYRWSVDGEHRPIDDAARRWFRGVLAEVFRATGLQAEARVAHLLRAGGVPAVLEEIGHVDSDHVAGIYFAETLRQHEPSREDAAALLSRAADTLGSDHELAELLAAIPSRLLAAPEVGRAYVDAARSIGSDHEAARVLLALAESSPAGEPLPSGFFRIAESIGSDHELGRVLAAVLEEGRTDEATVTRVLAAAEAIGSDHELAQLLVLVAETVRPEGELRARFLEVAESVGSDFEHERVLAAVE